MCMGVSSKPMFITSTHLDWTVCSPKILGEHSCWNTTLRVFCERPSSWGLWAPGFQTPWWTVPYWILGWADLSTDTEIAPLLIGFFVFSFSQLLYQEGYLCLPSNLINAGWWQIREEQTPAVEARRSSGLLLILSVCSPLRITRRTLWTESAFLINLINAIFVRGNS